MPDLRTRTVERFFKPGAVKGLQQVVQGVHLESTQGILIESGDEYYRWNLLGCQGFEDTEAIDSRHLNIQKDEIWIPLLDEADGLLGISAFADYFHIALGCQKPADPAASQCFIIHDQRFNFRSSCHGV